MIKYKCNKGMTDLSVSGALCEIEADIALLIRLVYDHLEDDDIKKHFKNFVREELYGSIFDGFEKHFKKNDGDDGNKNNDDKEVDEAIKKLSHELADLIIDILKDDSEED